MTFLGLLIDSTKAASPVKGDMDLQDMDGKAMSLHDALLSKMERNSPVAFRSADAMKETMFHKERVEFVKDTIP
jgi:hypothetical protein